ncbi:hypothetical protein [Aeoliella sp. SH292]|uniref:hypothetical protein n=1 Tax=Aeoliella sp. SH292 TaxID=3454464 RepID=UPI003F9A8F71
MTNPILNQLHDTRRQLLDEAGGTLEALVAAVQKRQQQSGRRIIKSQPPQTFGTPVKPAIQPPSSPIGGR